MTSKTTCTAIGAGLFLSTFTAIGGTTADNFAPAPSAPAELALPEFDFLKFTATQTGGMDFKNEPGDLSLTQYSLTAFLSRPEALTDSLTMIPYFSYSLTQLDFDNSAFPVGDEDFHSTSLSAIFVQDFANSPWFGVAWTRAELATDFQAIGEEDVTFDLALGVGYKVSDTLTVAAGFMAANFNGDLQFYPGLNFMWAPCEDFSMALYGANFFAKYEMNDNWYLSVNGEQGGGIWNINDAQGNSRSVDLDSYWVSLSTHHRITGELWFSAGLGYTFANEIEIRGNRGGGPSTSRELDGAPLAQISLSLHDW
ncbi:MAG: DUF6268 family outer membrane beta-barrel protein [Luteolibacter sp.]